MSPIPILRATVPETVSSSCKVLLSAAESGFLSHTPSFPLESMHKQRPDGESCNNKFEIIFLNYDSSVKMSSRLCCKLRYREAKQVSFLTKLPRPWEQRRFLPKIFLQ
jgi:hypothetical protein